MTYREWQKRTHLPPYQGSSNNTTLQVTTAVVVPLTTHAQAEVSQTPPLWSQYWKLDSKKHSTASLPALYFPITKKSSLLSLRTVVVKRKLTTRYFHWVEFYLKIYIKFKSLSRSLRLLILCINSKPSINIISVTSALFHNFDLLSMSLTNQFHFTFIITKAIPFTDLSSDLLV